jgi:hypothetical protein
LLSWLFERLKFFAEKIAEELEMGRVYVVRIKWFLGANGIFRQSRGLDVGIG